METFILHDIDDENNFYCRKDGNREYISKTDIIRIKTYTSEKIAINRCKELNSLHEIYTNNYAEGHKSYGTYKDSDGYIPLLKVAKVNLSITFIK